jgi:UDP-N-acetylglucosamine transferase subunit ALG13
MEYISFDDVVDIMRRADGVICHGGVGTIMTALRLGHTPVVIARLAQHGEHVDDHQLDIARRFAERGLVSCVTTETDITPLLASCKRDLAAQFGSGSSELRSAVRRAVAAASHRRLPAWPVS